MSAGSGSATAYFRNGKAQTSAALNSPRQVVAAVEEILEELLPAREPLAQRRIVVTGGDRVGRALPDLVEPLDEDPWHVPRLGG